MRKGKRTRPTVQSWLFALAMPAVGLFMLFSLMPYSRMVKPWPCGIVQAEVMAYQELFDRRPGQHVKGQAEQFTILEAGTGGKVVLSAGADTATATISPLEANGGTEAGFILDFLAGKPFRGMGSMVLVPAGLHSLDVLYAHAVADSLPILAPKVELVLLVLNGGKPVPYLAQEQITPGYLLLHSEVATELLGTKDLGAQGNNTGPAAIDSSEAARRQQVRGDRFDTAATAALGVLACAEQRPDLLHGSAGALYDRITARVEPMYRMRVENRMDSMVNGIGEGFKQALSDSGTEQRILRSAGRMHADSAAWAARFLAIDSAAVPVLAQGRNIGLVQAEVDHRRAAFMQRLFDPQPERFIGRPVHNPTPSDVILDSWLAQFRTQKDTLRFIRGKYSIDHDLVIPNGMAVVLEKGTRWFMASGVSVLIHGELHMRGTDLNPVFIRPQGDAAYGSIAVNGDGATRVRIRGLRMSGGSEMRADGIPYAGMLSFHRADVRMEHCSIEGSHGKASVSLRRCSLAMDDCTISNADLAAVDGSEVKGTVERSAFANSAAGMSLQAAHLLVRGCSFAGLRSTALSVGRTGRVLVSACSFKGNGTALVATDGSEVHVDGSDFVGNAKVFVLRRDSPVLGGATLAVYTNSFTGNATEREVDAASKVVPGAAVPAEVLQEFSVAKR